MKKILLSVLVMVAGVVMITVPVAAACPDGYVPAAILGNESEARYYDAGGNQVGKDTPGAERCIPGDDGNGSAIKNILKLVVRIMSVGIGVLAAIGIAVSGVQYLTAGGNEEKTRKAKRRIFEIVIGMAAYALIYAALAFLLPDF